MFVSMVLPDLWNDVNHNIDAQVNTDLSPHCDFLALTAYERMRMNMSDKAVTYVEEE